MLIYKGFRRKFKKSLIFFKKSIAFLKTILYNKYINKIKKTKLKNKLLYLSYRILDFELSYAYNFNKCLFELMEGDFMFYADKPISSISEDLLERKSFSKILAQTLVGLNNNETFTVGLFGKWGTGKTSIVNMTLGEIEKLQSEEENKTIVVRFEPWHFSDSTQLLTQFFIHLSNEFRSKKDKNLSKIGDALEKYSSAFELAKFIPTFGDIIATLGEKGASSLGRRLQSNADEQDIIKQKECVVDLLYKQKE